MSEAQVADAATAAAAQPVTEDDLKQLLAESRGQLETITRERDTERTGRLTMLEQLEQERRARLAAEGQHASAEARATSEAERTYNAEREALRVGILAHEQAAAAAEEALARNLEIGDHKAAAAAQRQLAQAESKLTSLRDQDSYLERNKAALVPAAPERRETPIPPTGRYSQHISGALAPGEQEWLDKRPKFLDSESYRREVIAASNLAVARGHARGTSGYFQEMEKVIGEAPVVTTNAVAASEEPRLPRPTHAPSSDLAPSRRASPGASPAAGGQEMRLTADEAEVANSLYGNPNSDDYIPEPAKRYERYWTNKQKLRDAGRS